MHKPKDPPPTTEQIWAKSGVPVETSTVIRGDMEQAVEVTGDINALNNVTISSKIAGRIAAVYAREGDTVSKGQTIVMLDQDDAISNLVNAQGGLQSAIAKLSQAKTNAKVTKIETNSSIEQAQSALDSAEAKLAVVKKPTRTQDRMVAENKVASTEADLENAKANFNRQEALLKDGAIAQSAYDVAKAQYKVAQADCKSAKDQLSLIKEGGRAEDISAAQFQVDVAEEQLERRKLTPRRISCAPKTSNPRSPGSSRPKRQWHWPSTGRQHVYQFPDLGRSGLSNRRAGQVVSPGQALEQIVNLSSIYFKGNVSEKGLSGGKKASPSQSRSTPCQNSNSGVGH